MGPFKRGTKHVEVVQPLFHNLHTFVFTRRLFPFSSLNMHVIHSKATLTNLGDFIYTYARQLHFDSPYKRRVLVGNPDGDEMISVRETGGLKYGVFADGKHLRGLCEFGRNSINGT